MDFYLTNIEKVTGLLDELRETYRQLLYENDHVVQGNPNKLADNIADLVQVEGNTIKIGFTLPAEWQYIENDTAPHWPPVDAIKGWIKEKPITPTPLQDGRIPTEDQLAYLIGRKIATDGTKGDHLLEEAIVKTDFFNRMIYIIKEEITAHANKEIKEILMTL